MFEQVRAHIEEILDIVERCPEKWQERCFDLLMSNLLQSVEGMKSDSRSGATSSRQTADSQATAAADPTATEKGGMEIKPSDLHIKVRKFLNDNGLTVNQLNALFYREGEEFKPLFETMGTTKMNESQIRLALLESLRRALNNGDFVFDPERVRQMCRDLKCYDPPNFTSNFKDRSDDFWSWPNKYSKGITVELLPEGKKVLAEVVQALTS